VYVNRKPVAGPWGGGTKSLNSIILALIDAGHNITFDMSKKFDVALIVDPRPTNDNNYDMIHNISRIYDAKIVQRVGDLGTHSKPELTELVKKTVQQSDCVIFPSTWACESVLEKMQKAHIPMGKDWFVIQNEPMRHFDCKPKEDLPVDISFVTHHWSTNAFKGFSFYKELDKISNFTYVGRAPQDIKYKNQIGPMDGESLVNEVSKHNVYVTASLHEAGANHVLEALAMGLPVIYHEQGGSIPEYCTGYGTSFDGTIESFNTAVLLLRETYNDVIKSRLSARNRFIDDMALSYVDIIEGQ